MDDVEGVQPEILHRDAHRLGDGRRVRALELEATAPSPLHDQQVEFRALVCRPEVTLLGPRADGPRRGVEREPSKEAPTLGWLSSARALGISSRAWSRPVSATYTFGVFTTRLPMFSLHGGSTRIMKVFTSTSRYRFTVVSATAKARASSAPFQICAW